MAAAVAVEVMASVDLERQADFGRMVPSRPHLLMMVGAEHDTLSPLDRRAGRRWCRQNI